MNVRGRWLRLGVLGLGVVAVLAAAGGGLPSFAATGPGKMAMILPGTLQDADYNAVGHLALRDVHVKYGIETADSENVAVADAERVAREYIAAGATIVAFHGGQFLTIVQKLAPVFPQVTFIMESSGRITGMPANVWVIGRKFYQGFYVLGALAALSTATGKVGYVAGIRLPDFIASLNAVRQALSDFNQKATLVYAFTGDQNDAVKARQTAESQIASGVDQIVVSVNLGVYGIFEAAQAAPRPVFVTSYYTDKYASSPKHFTASLLLNFSRPYTEIVGRILKGERTGYIEMRPGNGMALSPVRNTAGGVVAKVEAVFREVVNGKAVPEITDRILQ
jgi:basic membrane protein A and related proteins